MDNILQLKWNGIRVKKTREIGEFQYLRMSNSFGSFKQVETLLAKSPKVPN